MTAARIALVTGANKGIGFALVEGLAARMSPDDLVLLTGRNAQRVADAASRVTKAPARGAGWKAGCSTSPTPAPWPGWPPSYGSDTAEWTS